MSFSIKNYLRDHPEVVKINQAVTDWKTAIKISITPLIENGACNQEYYQSIIESTEKYGPYYILCPKVAMPHGKIGVGVFQDAVSLTVFNGDIEFSPNNNAQILMTLCAKSAEIHTAIALPQIAALFENEVHVETILKASSTEAIIDFINLLDLSKYLQ